MKLSLSMLVPILQRFKSKKILIPAAGVVLLMLIAAIFMPKSTAVTTAGVKDGDFFVTITVSGETRATKAMTISSPGVWYGSDMQVVWLIPEGTQVKEGQVICQLDTANVVKNMKDAQSQLNIHLSEQARMKADHKARMDQLLAEQKNAEFQYELSKLSYERVRFEAEVQRKEKELQLKRDSIAVDQARLKIASQEEIMKSELNKTLVEIAKAQSDVDKAKHDLGLFTLRAPMAGLVVYSQNWRNGRKIAVSDQVWPGMALMSLPDLSSMQTVGSVNEVDVSKVKNGQTVKVKLDAFPEREFHGTISSVGTIGQQADRNSNIKTFEVVVDLKESDPILRPGMTTSNEILVQTVPKSIYIPLESVFSKDGKTVVYKEDRFGYREIPVETGVRNSNFVTITKGISAGDKVTLRDPTLKEEELAGGEQSKDSKQ